MPAHPPPSTTVFQPRFRKNAAFQTISMWRPDSAADPNNLSENKIATSAMIDWTGLEKRYLYVLENDFSRKASAALELPWTYAETGTSTNFTGDYVTAGYGGVFRLSHSADSEAQTGRVDLADHLPIDITRPCFFECRFLINFAGATFSADQRAVIGLASAYSATLDNIVTNAWFRIEGASLSIKVETDDGTTDTDDVATGVSIVDNTYITVRIEVISSLVKFYIDGVAVTQTGCTLAALVSATGVQPIVAIQRDAGTEQEVVDIDYIRCGYLRA